MTCTCRDHLAERNCVSSWYALQSIDTPTGHRSGRTQGLTTWCCGGQGITIG